VDPVQYGFNTSTGVYFMSPALDELNYHDQRNTEELFGAPLLYAHRVDLHACLKHLATEPDGLGEPVKVHLKSGVSDYVCPTRCTEVSVHVINAIAQNPDIPSITLVDGTNFTADLVIAADGVHSKGAEVVLGNIETPQKPANRMNCAYRFLIPRADVEADPETRAFNHGHQQLGCRALIDGQNQRRLITYSCRK
jgi:salicylate hydroxylase